MDAKPHMITRILMGAYVLIELYSQLSLSQMGCQFEKINHRMKELQSVDVKECNSCGRVTYHLFQPSLCSQP